MLAHLLQFPCFRFPTCMSRSIFAHSTAAVAGHCLLDLILDRLCLADLKKRLLYYVNNVMTMLEKISGGLRPQPGQENVIRPSGAFVSITMRLGHCMA
jgi:hypothetical protein